MKALEEIKNLFEDGNYIVNYNSQIINEFSDENETLYTDDGDEISYNNLDIENGFNIFEIKEEYDFEKDIREIIKDLNRCTKDCSKYERGEKCFIIFETDTQSIFTSEMIDELYDIDVLENKLYNLKVLKLQPYKIL
jgi:ABC-type enterochelin transport system ATPase subunit